MPDFCLPPGVFRLCRRLLLPLFAALLPAAATAADIPLPDVSMILSGTLSASSDGKVDPADGDVVSIINVGSNREEATGTVSGNSYISAMSKPASFNGTQLVLRLKHLNNVYRLTTSTGSDAIITFNGNLLPAQTVFNLVATGTVVSTTGGGTTGGGTTGGTTTGGGTTGSPAPAALTGDVNGDKRVDEADIQLLKDGISGRRALDKTGMDVNKDGVVNTRDLIEVIRSVRNASRDALRPVSTGTRN